MLGYCFRDEGRLALYRRFLSDYSGRDTVVWDFCMHVGVTQLLDAPHPGDALEIVRCAYKSGIAASSGSLNNSFHLRRVELAPDIAREIARRPEEYPLSLLGRADEVLRELTAKRVEAVGRVAEREQWLRPPRGARR